MKVLVAEDDLFFRQALSKTLKKWGYIVDIACDGKEALAKLCLEDSPQLVILDWIMPELEGITVIKEFRAHFPSKVVYFLLLTSKSEMEDIVKGLNSGADDYITKPFNYDELKVRVGAGKRLVHLQNSLNERVSELEKTFNHLNQLKALLPICSACKKIRDSKNYWHQLEKYISTHADVNFSHGICPTCYQKHVIPQLKQFRSEKNR